jgi:hypothetical protein
MSKYDALADHLQTLERDREHTLTFAEIERVLGFRLPHSARTHKAWWANQKNGRHVQAKAWRAAGWQTKEPDLNAATVNFAAATKRKPMTGKELVEALTIAQAKKGLAAKFGVRPQDVEIIVRG